MGRNTRRGVGTVLVGAAVVMPAAAVAAAIALSHRHRVHVQQHQLLLWVVADAALLGLGFLLLGKEGL